MDYLRVLKQPNFLKLWGSQIFSQVAQNLLFFALIIRVFELAGHTKLANVSVALVVLAFGIPSIFFGPLAGVYVDFWNRKWVMVAANAARAALILLYPLNENNLAIILILSFVISSINQFFSPAEAASIPKLVSKRNLPAANAFFVFTMSAAIVIGYSSSAFALKFMGDDGPYLLTAALLGFAAFFDLLLPSMPSPHKRIKVPFGEEVRRVFGEVNDNLRSIGKSYKLYFPISQLTIVYSVIGIILALAPALSLALLKAPLKDSSHLVFIPAAVGLIVGVLLVTTLMKQVSSLRLAVYCFFVASILLTLLGLCGLLYHSLGSFGPFSVSTVGPIVAILIFILALFNSIISTASQTILQEETTDANRGRVFGALGMMVNIAATVPVFMAGILADVFSVTKVLTVLGICLTAYAVWQLTQMRRKTALLNVSQATAKSELSPFRTEELH